MNETTPIAILPGDPPSQADQPSGDYWYALVDENVAGEFLALVPRTMQLYRQKGGGPKFIRLSARCIRYRRIDLKAWTDERVRTSTADQGEADHAAT